MTAEAALAEALYAYWAEQQARVLAALRAEQDALAAAQAERQASKEVTLDWQAEEMQLTAQIGELLAQIVQGALAATAVAGVAVSWEVYEAQAAALAQKYGYDLIKQITDSTRQQLGKLISRWIETDADFQELVADVRKLIPTNPFPNVRDRAQLIAATEVTRVYADARAVNFTAAGLKQWVWRTAMDELVCPVCRPLGLENNGEGAVGTIAGGFQVPDAELVVSRPPAHPGCVLPGNIVAVPGLVAAAKSFYRGRVVEIETRGGRRLTVTQNHPVLTNRGWLAAQFLRHGDQVVAHVRPERIASCVNPYYHHVPATVEQIFSALVETPGMATTAVPVAVEDLHGDGGAVEGEIEIVGPDRELLMNDDPAVSQHCHQFVFQWSTVRAKNIASGRSFDTLGERGLAAAGGLVRRGGQRRTFLRTQALHTQGVGFGNGTERDIVTQQQTADCPAIDSVGQGELLFWNASFVSGDDGIFWQGNASESTGASAAANGHFMLPQQAGDGVSADTVLAGEFLRRNAGLVLYDDVVNVREADFVGHVYDLQSLSYELYTSNGIVVKNCRCWVVESVAELETLVAQQ